MLESAPGGLNAVEAGEAPAGRAPLLVARGLCKRFAVGRGRPPPMLHAVDAVELGLERGQSVGLVGESG